MNCLLQYLVHSILALICSELTVALTCYSHSGSRKTTTKVARSKFAVCLIEKGDGELQRSSTDAANRVLEPEKAQCIQYGDEAVECFCSTDYCNEHMPAPLWEPFTFPTDKLNCLQQYPGSRREEGPCSAGEACMAGISNDHGTQPIRRCAYQFIGRKRNGCLNEKYLHGNFTKICFCDTDKCDPLVDSDEPNNSALGSIGQFWMTIFIAWLNMN